MATGQTVADRFVRLRGSSARIVFILIDSTTGSPRQCPLSGVYVDAFAHDAAGTYLHTLAGAPVELDSYGFWSLVLSSEELDPEVGDFIGIRIRANEIEPYFCEIQLVPVPADIRAVDGSLVVDEPSPGVPSATPSVGAVFSWLWRMLRNKTTFAGGYKHLYDSEGVEVAKKACTDDGLTYIEDEMESA